MRVKGPFFPSFDRQHKTPEPRRQWVAHTGARARRRHLKQSAKQESIIMPSKGLAAAGVPIVGQPFTLNTIQCPVDVTLTCNCGGADVAVAITASTAAACPSCKKLYNVAFNPTTLKLEVFIGVPTDDNKRPS